MKLVRFGNRGAERPGAVDRDGSPPLDPVQATAFAPA